MTTKQPLIPAERVESRILEIRSLKVMLDADIAELFGVETRALNQAVKRNIDRFPEDFMFKLTGKEKAEVITNCDHLSKLKYSKALPHAFTEHGAIMAANVLNSPRAVAASVLIVRAFIKMRETLVSHKELAGKLKELERRLDIRDEDIAFLFEAIKRLSAPPKTKRDKIGFRKRSRTR